MRRIMTFVLAAIAVSTLCAAVPAVPSRPISLDMLRSGKSKLIVGCPDDWGDFDYRTKKGDFAGMDSDILREIARRLQIGRLDFRPTKFRDLAPALQAGDIDVIAATYWVLPERQKALLFTIPYYDKGGLEAFWLKGRGPFATPALMAGKRVGVVEGGYGETWARVHLRHSTIVPISGTDADVEKSLETKRIDLMLSNNLSARSQRARAMGRDYQRALLVRIPAAFAMRKGDIRLRDAFDSALRAMRRDGTLAKIESSYPEPDSSNVISRAKTK
jgi:lysine/arginine/ornithine transport system substrate-binding protein